MTSHRAGALPAIALLTVSLAVAACGGTTGTPGVATAGGSTASSGPGSDAAQQAQRYAGCLRGHGATLTARSDGTAEVDKARTPLATMRRATEQCRDLAPVGEAPARISAADLAKRQQYAACVRSHGVPEYPDPDPETGEPAMTEQVSAQVKRNSHFARAQETCRSILPGAPGNGEAATG